MTTRKYNRRKTKHRKKSKRGSRYTHKKKFYKRHVGGEENNMFKQVTSNLKTTLDKTTQDIKNNNRIKNLAKATSHFKMAFADTIDKKISKKKSRNRKTTKNY